MLVLPWPNLARLRVVEVVKGDVKPRSCIDLNDISRLAEGASRVAVPLLLLRDRRWQSWVYIVDPARTRDPVIPMLMKEHKDLAGYVVREFAERGYWDAVPEYSPCSRRSCRIPHRVTRC